MIGVIQRRLQPYLRQVRAYYPVVSITGPRQAGKTTLARLEFADYRYVNFEDIRLQESFRDDPRGFLEVYDGEVIFDEAQRVPQLFNYLLTVVDEDRRPGRFVLSGSQNFLMNKQITQSLAGRVGHARLLPLDLGEVKQVMELTDPELVMFRSMYPQAIRSDMPSEIFYSDYIASYLDRDISPLIQDSNMLDFRRFLTSCAAGVGQLLNYSTLARDIQVSVNTIKQWVHYLQQTYIAFTVEPYFSNVRKGLTKQPKLYFYDTGLAAYLLRLSKPEELRLSMYYGALFENLVIADRRKTRYHQGNLQPFYFYRDDKKLEVDYLDGSAEVRILAEIKASKTPGAKHTANLGRAAQLVSGDPQLMLIHGGHDSYEQAGITYRSWTHTEPLDA